MQFPPITLFCWTNGTVAILLVSQSIFIGWTEKETFENRNLYINGRRRWRDWRNMFEKPKGGPLQCNATYPSESRNQGDLQTMFTFFYEFRLRHLWCWSRNTCEIGVVYLVIDVVRTQTLQWIVSFVRSSNSRVASVYGLDRSKQHTIQRW